MDFDQKISALCALSAVHVGVDINNKIYVALKNVEIKKGGVLESPVGRGQYLNGAIENLWGLLTTRLGPSEYLVKSAMQDKDRIAVRWNGFMWSPVVES